MPPGSSIGPNRGEWPQEKKKSEEEEEEGDEEDAYREQCRAQCKNVQEIYNAAALELLQLQELRKVEKEEAMMTSPMDAKLVLKLQKECREVGAPSEGIEHCGKEL